MIFPSDPKIQTPNHFILNVLLNAPLPLWTPNLFVRGKNYRFVELVLFSSVSFSYQCG